MRITVMKNLFSASTRRWCSTGVSSLPRAEVEGRVANVVRNLIAVQDVSPDAPFVAGMGLDRVQVKGLIQQLAAEFCVDVPHTEANRMINVSAATDFFANHPKAR
eukprot:CAMPEP_0185024716 /NCGR_PEP_ID=MMETSP1103-20130426/7901_1 /TAXON_ID=36769 /ORGANISM="Paraphysomonas bandaiensis, Strain Caron Lab Isolate" /LENGTH=104 /DNA_ID=CAMNT_0027557753 /DNA_START=38 /DNA_END=352 /DNA_ORIENTATION=-